MTDRGTDRRTALILGAVAAAIVPRGALERLPPICTFRMVTGYPCPTCGMVRSWHSVAQFDPVRALQDHPFGPLVLIALAAGAWSPDLADAMARRTARLPTGVKAVALASWLGWWAARLAATRRSRPGLRLALRR